ncbi:hypothetical protein LJR251_001876 [Rhizobium rhizogenes]|jgi:hypothetical protein|uniref:hypothetical protein n=1 Tax=Rhizobium rhizogenes TaxID=359 RepID=UPI000645B983|nr:hypothetical protein [Rhizobium rhizogenes]
MSTLAESLKKQNGLLQGEVERFANAVDSLAAQLVDAQNQLKALQAVQPEIAPTENSVLIDGEVVDAEKIDAQQLIATSEKRLREER